MDKFKFKERLREAEDESLRFLILHLAMIIVNLNNQKAALVWSADKTLISAVDAGIQGYSNRFGDFTYRVLEIYSIESMLANLDKLEEKFKP